MEVKGNYFRTSDGVNIYFEDYGTGEPMVLIPGFLCTARFFRKNVDTLSENHRLIIIECRGHGSSGKAFQGMNMPRLAEDVKELIEYLELEEVSLIGWSLGGNVVMEYYSRFRNYRLKRLGVIDSALFPFGSEEYNAHSLKGYNMDGCNRSIRNATRDHDSYCRGFCRNIFKNPPQDSDMEWVVEEISKCPVWLAFALYEDYAHRNYIPVLEQINIPAMICGANSPSMPAGIRMSEAYYEMIHSSKMFHKFENGGHVMFYECPDEFNSVIQDFMKLS